MPLFCEPPKGELKYPPTNLSKINHKGEWSLNNDQISPLFSGLPFIDNSRHVQKNGSLGSGSSLLECMQPGRLRDV